MPGLDQTGPFGQGSMTGRRMGRCVSNQQMSEENLSNQSFSDNQSVDSGFGRGLGVGRMNRNNSGRGFGFGRGRCCGQRFRRRMG